MIFLVQWRMSKSLWVPKKLFGMLKMCHNCLKQPPKLPEKSFEIVIFGQVYRGVVSAAYTKSIFALCYDRQARR